METNIAQHMFIIMAIGIVQTPQPTNGLSEWMADTDVGSRVVYAYQQILRHEYYIFLFIHNKNIKVIGEY